MVSNVNETFHLHQKNQRISLFQESDKCSVGMEDKFLLATIIGARKNK